jgi:hypothetical protein
LQSFLILTSPDKIWSNSRLGAIGAAGVGAGVGAKLAIFYNIVIIL